MKDQAHHPFPSRSGAANQGGAALKIRIEQGASRASEGGLGRPDWGTPTPQSSFGLKGVATEPPIAIQDLDGATPRSEQPSPGDACVPGPIRPSTGSQKSPGQLSCMHGALLSSPDDASLRSLIWREQTAAPA